MSTCLLLAVLTTSDAAAVLPQQTVDQFAWVIGEWNGVAQPRRGSSAGSWRESSDWAFDFAGTDPIAIEFTVDGGELIETLRIEPDGESLNAVVTRPSTDETLQLPQSELSDKHWVFGGEGDPLRLTFRKLSDIRLVLLIETPRGTRFTRVAEVGYTRSGERLASSDVSGNVCVVTGGRGTMEVTHAGKTYWVCCTGCRQAFGANPEKVIAAAKDRAAKAKAAN